MHLVEEKTGTTVVDEDDALLLVFWRLGGGDAEELPFDVSADIKLREGADDSEVHRARGHSW